MTNEALIDTQTFTVRLRSRGQVTLPRKLRETLAVADGDTLTLTQVGDAILLTAKPLKTFALADQIADMMEKEGLSLAELLEELPNIRSDIYQERYKQP